jgi:REP element-mobilizing transposase RayT
MASSTPLQYGQYYHIFNRGKNRDNIFFEDRNYRYFLQLYTKHIEPVADTYTYCLLPNHFHLLVRIKFEDEQTLGVSETPRVLKPSQQYGNLFNAYAKAINKAYNRTGSLFQNPFGRKPVDSDAYFLKLVAYIHQNPQKHGIAHDFRDWTYSSFHALRSEKPTRLKRDDVLKWFDGVEGFNAYHCQEIYEAQVALLVPDDFD